VSSLGARRRAKALAVTLAALAVAGCLCVAGWLFLPRFRGADTPEFLTTTVWKGRYDFAVVEQGIVESASNTELRCDVRSRGGGTMIVDVVPEGTIVKKGDTVVELDASKLLEEADAQKIVISTRQSLLAQAENTLKAAEIAKTEYLEGLYVTQEKQFLSELFLAERARGSAETTLESTQALYAKNIVSALQLETAKVNLDDASIKLNAAQTNLNTLRNLTRPKQVTSLDAAVASALAQVKAQRRNLQLEQERLKDIENQITRCTIKAPSPGQVVYASERDSYFSSSQSQFIVGPGAMVRERQVIVWLPNTDDMQIRATVNEARVTLVRPGLPVSIRVSALKDEIIEGEVTKVNQFAEPSGYWGGNINKYATTIKIKNPPPDLRVGMNAEVRIHVERITKALQVPVQTLAESKGHFFSLVKNGDQYETREVKIGSTNDSVATINRGLEEGDEVIMYPRSAGGLLKFPDMPDATSIGMGEIKRTQRRKSAIGAVAGNVGHLPADGQRLSETTPAELVAQYLENDVNHDQRLSKDEIARMDIHIQQRLAAADANGDGFLERRELLMVAANAVEQRRGKDNGSAGGGGDRQPGRREQGLPGSENEGRGVVPL